MNINNEVKLLRIFMSNTDKFKHEPLYEVIVYDAKRYGIAGASVLKGVMGFGASSAVNSMKFWEISEKLPVIVEIIDNAEKIESFFETIKPYFDKIEKGFLVTIETVNVVLYKSGKKK
jgi:PII-like signaling protein